jgi:hypothetical protein
MIEETTKIVTFLPSIRKNEKNNENKEIIDNKEIKKRKVTEKWNFDTLAINQFESLCSLVLEPEENSNKNISNVFRTEIRRQIHYKLHSYRSQDVKKSLLDESQFVNYEYVIELLREKQLKCFYCKETVLLMYDAVRDSKQWTLDRMDNSMGHNRGNVEIACLICNLRRRTMYHERYVFTKQVGNIKKIN